jgi:hypothetical protein
MGNDAHLDVRFMARYSRGDDVFAIKAHFMSWIESLFDGVGAIARVFSPSPLS